MRVLIAEDNVAMAHVLRFNLQRAGFSVQLATDGRLALQFAQAESFDLVITDFQMPGLNGEELCRAIRELPDHTDTPVVMCTAKGLELDPQYLHDELGVTCLVRKPFSPRQIVEMATALVNDRVAVPV